MRRNSSYLILIIFVLLFRGASQAYNDSISDFLSAARNDTLRIEMLIELGKKQQHSDPSIALGYIIEANELSKAIGYKEGEAFSYTRLGTNYWYQANYDLALKYYLKSLLVHEELLIRAVSKNDSLGVLRFKAGMAGSNMGLGIVYIYLKDYDQTIVYYNKALEINRDINNSKGIADCLNNIGSVFYRKREYEKALDYYDKSLIIYERTGYTSGIATNLSGISNIHYQRGNIEKSIETKLKALDIYRSLGNKYEIARVLNNIAEAYSDIGDFQNVESYSLQSLKIAKESGAKKNIKNSYQRLAEVYAANKDFKNAFEYAKLFSSTKDSLFNADKSKEIGKLEANYKMEKQLEGEKRLAAEVAKIEREEKSRSNNLQYSGILIFLVLLGAALMMLGKFRIPVHLAEGLIFFTFLLLFEFSLVLLDPFIDTYSSGAPAIKLSFNAVLAAVIFPLHSFFGQSVKRRLGSS